MIVLHPKIQLFGICFPTFSFVLLFSTFICVLFYSLSTKYTKYNQIKILSSFPAALVSAAIVGRLFSAFTLTIQNGEPFWVNLFNGGNVLYAAVTGGLISLFFIAKKRGDSVIDYYDVYSTIIPLGISVGRVGCYFNGCCYGIAYSGPFSVCYFVDGKKTMVFPTWFVESFFCLILFLTLHRVINRNQRGQATTIFCISYAAYRFGIEFARGDAIRGFWHGLSTSQYFSVVVLILGLVLMFTKSRKQISNIFYSSETNSKGAN